MKVKDVIALIKRDSQALGVYSRSTDEWAEGALNDIDFSPFLKEDVEEILAGHDSLLKLYIK